MSTAWREHVHGSIEPLADTRKFDWFEITCCVVMVALTVATVGFIYWSQP